LGNKRRAADLTAYAHPSPVDAVDGRKGIDSLVQLCREKLAADPFSGCLFFFRSRSRQSHDYERHGVTSLFAALDVASGVTISNCYRRHRHQEFLRFLNDIDANLPGGFDVHLVMDNYGTHRVSKVRSWLARHPRYHVHFTPTSGSWLNLVERLFAEVTERCVRRGSHTTVRALEKALLDYLDQRNRAPKPFLWTAPADLILGKVERLCERISDSGH
jgi:transposase